MLSAGGFGIIVALEVACHYPSKQREEAGTLILSSVLRKPAQRPVDASRTVEVGGHRSGYAVSGNSR